ncbi:hypothetical protein BJV74DRAFT_800175 [Russula compacta]|nr:hypothetical protein BJV74DRAFT_800175 [Russula compacta]
MPQGKAVSEEVQWVVVHMAATMSVEDITMYTQISPRKVHGIISHFNTHCTVCTPACAHTKVHHALSDDHINHLLQTLNSMPDLYLDKLHIELEATMPSLVSNHEAPWPSEHAFFEQEQGWLWNVLETPEQQHELWE